MRDFQVIYDGEPSIWRKPDYNESERDSYSWRQQFWSEEERIQKNKKRTKYAKNSNSIAENHVWILTNEWRNIEHLNWRSKYVAATNQQIELLPLLSHL